MQLAGRLCSITGQKIQLAADGIGCSTCDKAYLRSSILGSQCPQCHQDMAVQAEQRLMHRSKETEAVLSKGRSRFRFVGVVELLESILSLIGAFVAPLIDTGSSGVISILAGLFLWTVSRGGNRFTRILLMIHLTVSAFWGGLIAIRVAQEAAVQSAVILILYTLANFISLYFLFTHCVNAYLDDQRQPGQD
jgi:hypothetical protein